MKIRKPESKDIQFGQRLSTVPVNIGLPDAEDLWEELQEYIDVLAGRTDSPIESPYLALAECATAYYARALEIDAHIHAGERNGVIAKGSPYYRFRTGELRSFIELAKKKADLGSRRLTQEQVLQQQRFDSGL